jgi:hypothetical protein
MMREEELMHGIQVNGDGWVMMLPGNVSSGVDDVTASLGWMTASAQMEEWGALREHPRTGIEVCGPGETGITSGPTERGEQNWKHLCA